MPFYFLHRIHQFWTHFITKSWVYIYFALCPIPRFWCILTAQLIQNEWIGTVCMKCDWFWLQHLSHFILKCFVPVTALTPPTPVPFFTEWVTTNNEECMPEAGEVSSICPSLLPSHGAFCSKSTTCLSFPFSSLSSLSPIFSPLNKSKVFLTHAYPC